MGGCMKAPPDLGIPVSQPSYRLSESTRNAWIPPLAITCQPLPRREPLQDLVHELRGAFGDWAPPPRCGFRESCPCWCKWSSFLSTAA